MYFAAHRSAEDLAALAACYNAIMGAGGVSPSIRLKVPRLLAETMPAEYLLDVFGLVAFAWSDSCTVKHPGSWVWQSLQLRDKAPERFLPNPQMPFRAAVDWAKGRVIQGPWAAPGQPEWEADKRQSDAELPADGHGEPPAPELEPAAAESRSDTGDMPFNWQAALEKLRFEMPKHTFETKLRGTRCELSANGQCRVLCQSVYDRDWIQNRLKGAIERVLRDLTGAAVSVEFAVQSA
jgi:hypothetical protein